MLIWAIDQDTDDLQALRGLVGDNNLKLFQREAENAGDWEVSAKDLQAGCGPSLLTYLYYLGRVSAGLLCDRLRRHLQSRIYNGDEPTMWRRQACYSPF
jgi:hypothetical protein